MKKKIIAAMAVLGMVGLAQASTIGWNFDDLDGIVDVNDSGLAVSEYTAYARTSAGVISTSVWDTAVTDGMMKTGATKVLKTNDSHHRFTVTIGAGDTVDFTKISFEQGADKQDAKEWDPDLNLAIIVGGTTNQVIDLSLTGPSDLPVAGGFYSFDHDLTLTGLTGLTDTTVEFDFNFNNYAPGVERNNSIAWYADTVDDVSLTVIPEPATLGMVALTGAGLLFVRRRLQL